MKVKVKLDAKTLQELLLQNVEKIGLAVVALIFLLMVYSAFNKVERYKKTPEQLIQIVNQGKKTIDDSQLALDVTVPDYLAQAKGIRDPIKETNYATQTPWTNPLFAPPSLRPEPPLWAAKDVRGKPGVGGIMEVAAADHANTQPADPAMPAPPMGGTATATPRRTLDCGHRPGSGSRADESLLRYLSHLQVSQPAGRCSRLYGFPSAAGRGRLARGRGGHRLGQKSKGLASRSQG